MNEQDNFGRLSQAVALLGDTLRPYVERELKRSGGNWWTEYVLPAVSPLTRQKLPALPKKGVNGQLSQVDVGDLLQLITKNWAVVFRGRLPDSARSWAEELRSSRNDWAHKGAGDVSAAVVDSRHRHSSSSSRCHRTIRGGSNATLERSASRSGD